MSDVGYIVAAYGLILGGMAAYAWLLLRRLGRARRALDDIRRATEVDPRA